MILYIYTINSMKRPFHITKKARLWIILGFVAIILSIYTFVTNINPSIEFTWWVQLQTDVSLEPEKVLSEMGTILEENWFGTPTVKVDVKENWSSITVQASLDNQEKVQSLSDLITTYINDNWGEVLSQSVTGASVGEYLQSSAKKALVFWLIAIALYMIFAFASIREIVSPVILAIVVIFSLIFALAIPAGAYGLLMATNPTEQLNLVFIASILTVMWYSINDTIIIFDRIRENMKIDENALRTGKVKYIDVFEDSLWQTMRRSFITSLTTLIVILAMRIFGTWVIQTFAFVMGIGVFAAAISSIFLAAPATYLFVRNAKKRP